MIKFTEQNLEVHPNLRPGLDLPGGGVAGAAPAGKTATPAGEHLQKMQQWSHFDPRS